MQKETKDILKRSAVRSLWIVAIVLGLYLLQGCGNPRLAPVEEREATGDGAKLHSFYPPTEVDNSQQFYIVQPADTLYSIAFRYGFDYKTLAESNNIDATYTIYPGQKLDLEKARHYESERQVDTSQIAQNDNSSNTAIRSRRGVQEVSRTAVTTVERPTTASTSKPKSKPANTSSNTAKQPKPKKTASASETVSTPKKAQPVKKKPKAKPATTNSYTSRPVKYWMWPNMGKLIKRFSGVKGSRGIDIAGNMGEPVRAAAPGLVVYAGRGLRGYGNLVIVKHNNDFISAYAHNKRILVKENEIIKAGQKIAEIGNSDSDIPKLHFEIRFKGKPVDPLRYLPKR